MVMFELTKKDYDNAVSIGLIQYDKYWCYILRDGRIILRQRVSTKNLDSYVIVGLSVDEAKEISKFYKTQNANDAFREDQYIF
jgi:hypothetical protein